jgi:hypothetical protein
MFTRLPLNRSQQSTSNRNDLRICQEADRREARLNCLSDLSQLNKHRAHARLGRNVGFLPEIERIMVPKRIFKEPLEFREELISDLRTTISLGGIVHIMHIFQDDVGTAYITKDASISLED